MRVVVAGVIWSLLQIYLAFSLQQSSALITSLSNSYSDFSLKVTDELRVYSMAWLKLHQYPMNVTAVTNLMNQAYTSDDERVTLAIRTFQMGHISA